MEACNSITSYISLLEVGVCLLYCHLGYVFSVIASYYTEIVFSVAVWVGNKRGNEEVCQNDKVFKKFTSSSICYSDFFSYRNDSGY